MTDSKTLGLYLHIPFCRSRCYYCGFYSVGSKLTDSFLDALVQEMENKSKLFEDKLCDTVYLGGGTPSVLSGNQLKSIIEALHRYFHIYENAEITMEMNPCDMTEAYLKNDTNNTSIVCLLENDVCNVLFSGDLEESGWKKLLERMPELKCEILKMPHHGAFYDEKSVIGLKQILEILQPRDVIISSGDNKKYKHPDIQTI